MQQQPQQQPPQQVEAQESLLVRFGGFAFGALIAAIFGALPAVMRMGSSVPTVLMLVAVLIVPAALLTALFIFARQALRSFAADGNTLVASLLLWGSGMALSGAMVGTVLRATTHHWALSAVTFSLAMLVAAPALALFVRRFATLANESTSRVRAYVLVSGVAFVVALIVLSVRIGHGNRETAAVVLDMTAWIVGALLGSTPMLRQGRQVRIMSYVAPPLCVVIALVGLKLASPARVELAKTRAPAFSVLLHSVPGVSGP